MLSFKERLTIARLYATIKRNDYDTYELIRTAEKNHLNQGCSIEFKMQLEMLKNMLILK
mgnify:CR=1